MDSDWEVQKENIQPRSSRRNVFLMKHSEQEEAEIDMKKEVDSQHRLPSTIRTDIIAALPTDSHATETGAWNLRIMCSVPHLRDSKNARHGSFEHRHQVAWLKKQQEKETVAQLLKDKAQLESKLFKAYSILEFEQKLCENLEAQLRQKSIMEEEWEREKVVLNETVINLTREMEDLKDELALILRFRDLKNDTTGYEAAPEPEAPAFLLPPPRSVGKKFSLYESINPDSESEHPRGGMKHDSHVRRPVLEKAKTIDIQSLSENKPSSLFVLQQENSDVAGIRIPFRNNVSSKVAEIEARNQSENTHSGLDTFPTKIGRTVPQLGPAFACENMPPCSEESDDHKLFAKSQLYETYLPPALPFDTSNLTCALQMGPPPLLNSTPQRNAPGEGYGENTDRLCSGNYVHTQRIPTFSQLLREVEPEPESALPDGPLSPTNEEARQRDFTEWRQERLRRVQEMGGFPTYNYNESVQMNLQLNLSPIQETSKENRSSCTTGSSSSNITRGAGVSGVSMFSSRSVSSGARSTCGSATRSIRYTYPNQN